MLVLVVAAFAAVRVLSDEGSDSGSPAASTRRTIIEPSTTEAPVVEPPTTVPGRAPATRAGSFTPPLGDANPTCRGAADGTLTIGGLLPETGDLAFLDPAMDGAAQLAVTDVNAAGGVLGRDVAYLPGDSGDISPDLANPTLDRHEDDGVDVVLGAAASGISLDVVDRVTAACRIQFSPSNTSPVFTDYDDGDLYFRTAPSDSLQGQAIADLMVEDGVATAAVLARGDSYGLGLLDYTTAAFERQGGQVVLATPYDPEIQAAAEADVAAVVDPVVSANPEALVLIGFDESADVLSALYERGFTSDTHGIYLSDGNTGNALGDSFSGPGTLAGIKGMYAGAETPPAFVGRLRNSDTSIVDFLFAAETYDAVVITALATVLAGTDDPAAVARQINGVTRDGEICRDFAGCLALVESGVDIDYSGPSGPQDFSLPGEPTIATFTVEEFGADNRLDPTRIDHRLARLP